MRYTAVKNCSKIQSNDSNLTFENKVATIKNSKKKIDFEEKFIRNTPGKKRKFTLCNHDKNRALKKKNRKFSGDPASSPRANRIPRKHETQQSSRIFPLLFFLAPCEHPVNFL